MASLFGSFFEVGDEFVANGSHSKAIKIDQIKQFLSIQIGKLFKAFHACIIDNNRNILEFI